jgi:hypothetical protein
LFVQLWQRGTHEVCRQKKPLPPSGLGVHGGWTPPSGVQQSALVTHAPPGATHDVPTHRGTPTLSGWQVSWVSQLPEQQSHGWPQAEALSLQTCPLGWQVWPASFWIIDCVQRPSVAPAAFEHAPEWLPQQSESCVQRSPVTWHPLAGWHTTTPVGPKGAQSALQQFPPQAIAPASVTRPPHTVPSTQQLPVPVAVGGPAQ